MNLRRALGGRAARVVAELRSSDDPVGIVSEAVAWRYRMLVDRYGPVLAPVRYFRTVRALTAGPDGLMRSGLALRARPLWLITAQPGRRLDLFIRILAVEEFAGSNSVGARLYDRFMDHPLSAGRSARAFSAVFDSIVAYGLRSSEPLKIHANRVLGDGWHRLACAIHLGHDELALRLIPRGRTPFVIGPDVLRERGFSERDVSHVLETETRVLARLRSAPG